jgi:hypothetical protein
VQILKGLFAPKWCKFQGYSELRILKDLAAIARDCGQGGVVKLLILKEQLAQKQKRLRRIGGALLYRKENITFLKIVKRKMGSVFNYPTY